MADFTTMPLPNVPGLSGSQAYVRSRTPAKPQPREDGNILAHDGQEGGDELTPRPVARRAKGGPKLPPRGGKVSANEAYAASSVPSYVRNEREVFRFFGYIDETVTEGGVVEVRRIKEVTLLYFLTDHTWQVEAVAAGDAGIAGGLLLRRTKVPQPDGGVGEYLKLNDVRVGEPLRIFGLNMNITDADEKTRAFSKDVLGVEQPAAVAVPVVEAPPPGITGAAPRPTDPNPAARPQSRSDKLKYYQRENVTLKFEAVDASVVTGTGAACGPLGGATRAWYKVYFYYQNDTVEIRHHATNSLVLKRGRLPKDGSNYVPTGYSGSLNNSSDDGVPFVDLSDLRVGRFLNVYGRRLLVAQTDARTAAFLLEKGLVAGPEETQPLSDEIVQQLLDIAAGMPATPAPVPETSDANDENAAPTADDAAAAAAKASMTVFASLFARADRKRFLRKHLMAYDVDRTGRMKRSELVSAAQHVADECDFDLNFATLEPMLSFFFPDTEAWELPLDDTLNAAFKRDMDAAAALRADAAARGRKNAVEKEAKARLRAEAQAAAEAAEKAERDAAEAEKAAAAEARAAREATLERTSLI